jgi:hypothetical protein
MSARNAIISMAKPTLIAACLLVFPASAEEKILPEGQLRISQAPATPPDASKAPRGRFKKKEITTRAGPPLCECYATNAQGQEETYACGKPMCEDATNFLYICTDGEWTATGQRCD